MRSTLARLPPTVKELLSRSSAESSQQATALGWIRSVRQQKRVSFVEVNDGSTCQSLQAVLSPDQGSRCAVGSSVRMVGELQESRGAKQASELKVHTLDLLGHCEPDYPMQKKEHSAAFLRKFPHLRPRTETTASMLRLRDACSAAVADHLRSELGFIHVEAPILTNSDCEGGSSVFRVESDEHFPSPSTSSQQQQGAPQPGQQLKSFFSSPTYLTVSSQLYLEAISASISRVFTLGPAFRAERSLTSRHLSEFWMLEGELSFIQDLDSLLDVVEGCVRAAQRSFLNLDVSFSSTLSSTSADNKTGEHIQRALEQRWPRVSYDEAIRLLNAHHGTAEWGADLSTEQERWLAEQHFQSPVFVTDYPAALKPFYMRRNASSEQQQQHDADGRATVACFDLLVPGVGELAGGSLREERMDVLLESMRLKGLNEEDYGWYLDLRKYGTVPHGGFGLGWERLISWMSGLENVRECIAFPRAKEGFKV